MLKIDGYPVDVEVSGDFAFVNEVTEYPVESGSDVVDHVRTKPMEITIEGVVSDTPIGEIANEREAGVVHSRTAYIRLKEIHARREPVTLDTSRGRFVNMVLARLSTPTSAATGDSLQFTGTFKEVRLITNERTTIRVRVPRARKKEKKSAQSSGTPIVVAPGFKEAEEFRQEGRAVPTGVILPKTKPPISQINPRSKANLDSMVNDYEPGQTANMFNHPQAGPLTDAERADVLSFYGQ